MWLCIYTWYRCLYQQNIQKTQLSLTNRATHLCKCNGVYDLIKHALPHMCYHCPIWSFCVKGCRHKYTRASKSGEGWNSALSWWEAWTTPWYAPSHTCCHVKFGSSVTKGVFINRKKWGALALRSFGVGALLTPESELLAIVLPRQIW